MIKIYITIWNEKLTSFSLWGSSLLVTRLFQKNRSYFGEEMVLQLTLEIKKLEAKIEKIKKEWHLY